LHEVITELGEGPGEQTPLLPIKAPPVLLDHER
jgi:hypothetical protein